MNTPSSSRQAKETTPQRRKTTQIHSDNEQFLLNFADGDRCVESGEKLLLAHKFAERYWQDLSSNYLEPIGWLLGKVRDWCNEQRDRINSAYLCPESHSIGENSTLNFLFLVEQAEVPYDEELDDSLIALDLATFQDEQSKGLVSLSVLLIPPTDEAGRSTFLAENCSPAQVV